LKEDDCRWCAQRGLTCGDKLLGEKHQIREHRRLLGIGNTPLSVISAQLELAYPRRTPWEISEMAREALILAGDGPEASENLSREGTFFSALDEVLMMTGKSVTPNIDRAESVKLENSPKTPTLTLQSQTFLSASQRTPPRTTRLSPRNNSLLNEPLPSYDYASQFSAVRPQYDERDQAAASYEHHNPNYFAEVKPSLCFVILIAVENYGEWSLVTSSGSRLAGTGVREEISVFFFFVLGWHGV
jgi:hypothetical protein